VKIETYVSLAVHENTTLIRNRRWLLFGRILRLPCTCCSTERIANKDPRYNTSASLRIASTRLEADNGLSVIVYKSCRH